VPTHLATYQLDDTTTVMFEVESADGFRPAGPGQVAGKVREAVGPTIQAAKEVLDKVQELRPHEVEVAFGVKVSGGAQWLIAKAAGEASFEITLRWSAKPEPPRLPTVKELAKESIPDAIGASSAESAEET
jgi:phage tail sheath gpL-like